MYACNTLFRKIPRVHRKMGIKNTSRCFMRCIKRCTTKIECEYQIFIDSHIPRLQTCTSHIGYRLLCPILPQLSMKIHLRYDLFQIFYSALILAEKCGELKHQNKHFQSKSPIVIQGISFSCLNCLSFVKNISQPLKMADAICNASIALNP